MVPFRVSIGLWTQICPHNPSTSLTCARHGTRHAQGLHDSQRVRELREQEVVAHTVICMARLPPVCLSHVFWETKTETQNENSCSQYIR